MARADIASLLMRVLTEREARRLVVGFARS